MTILDQIATTLRQRIRLPRGARVLAAVSGGADSVALVWLLADLARRLNAVKEGNGTMLDNTLIVWMSDSGEGHHGFCSEWPLVLVGGRAGRLKTAGRFLQFPAYKE